MEKFYMHKKVFMSWKGFTNVKQFPDLGKVLQATKMSVNTGFLALQYIK